MRREYGGGPSEGTEFSQSLAALKRDGCNVLLVGDALRRADRRACSRLLGDDADDDRCRLFVFTDADGARERLPEAVGVGTRALVQHDGDGNLPAGATAVDARMLSVLCREFVAVVDEFEAERGGLAPGELRVCVDSLRPLLNGYASENVFRLLHMLSARVREADGLGHFHLPVARDADAVNLLEPLFDAVVEVRADGGGAEHRWHLRESGVSSDWIDL
ncbi:DUF7504 family protein [Halostella litorea]|uniref:DUF7504 family protein n=1 Tax=Halostella litorea TaxID=2528831 RepID=UPI0010932A11|nr:hypothetical protein [Halostella litorea]